MPTCQPMIRRREGRVNDSMGKFYHSCLSIGVSNVAVELTSPLKAFRGCRSLPFEGWDVAFNLKHHPRRHGLPSPVVEEDITALCKHSDGDKTAMQCRRLVY